MLILFAVYFLGLITAAMRFLAFPFSAELFFGQIATAILVIIPIFAAVLILGLITAAMIFFFFEKDTIDTDLFLDVDAGWCGGAGIATTVVIDAVTVITLLAIVHESITTVCAVLAALTRLWTRSRLPWWVTGFARCIADNSIAATWCNSTIIFATVVVDAVPVITSLAIIHKTITTVCAVLAALTRLWTRSRLPWWITGLTRGIADNSITALGREKLYCSALSTTVNLRVTQST
jgi:hypothetical protein